MPKKLNFLGGQQNYDPKTGEYQPALKGPNGESPSGFSSFKKGKAEDKNESFDAINKKRMGKEQKSDIKFNPNDDHYKLKSPEITNTDAYLTAPIVSALEKAEGRSLENDELRKIVKDMAEKNPNATPEEFEKMLLNYKGGSNEEPKGSTQYFKHPEVNGVWHDTGKTIEKGGNSYKVYENEQGKTWAVSDRFAKQFQPFDKDKKTELLSKDYLDKFYELSGGDENKMLDLIRKDPAYQNNDTDPNDTWSMGDLEGVVGAYFEKRSNQSEDNDEDAIWDKYNKGEITEQERNKLLSERSERIVNGGNSFDQINAKRMGKEQPKSEETAKSHKSADRKDKYGNPLVSDDAFKVGQKAAKEYLDQLNKGEGFDAAKSSFVTLGGFRDAISDAIEQAGLNPDYDLTYQDLNEIIGSVTGEEIDFEDYEGNGKGWTGKKYSGYDPNKTKETTKNKKTVEKLEGDIKKTTVGNKITWEYGENNKVLQPGFKRSLETTENGWVISDPNSKTTIERVPGGQYKYAKEFYTRDDGGRKKKYTSDEKTFNSFEEMADDVSSIYLEEMKKTKGNFDSKYAIDDTKAQELMKKASKTPLTDDEKNLLKEYYANQMKKYGL